MDEISKRLLNTPELNQPRAYVPRLVAFIIILYAIVDKNRVERRRAKAGSTVVELYPRRLQRRA